VSLSRRQRPARVAQRVRGAGAETAGRGAGVVPLEAETGVTFGYMNVCGVISCPSVLRRPAMVP
jgi:hypothetical protein